MVLIIQFKYPVGGCKNPEEIGKCKTLLKEQEVNIAEDSLVEVIPIYLVDTMVFFCIKLFNNLIKRVSPTPVYIDNFHGYITRFLFFSLSSRQIVMVEISLTSQFI